MRFPQTLSSEFPNDNPRLHQGASWLCLDPLSAARPVARPDAVAKSALTLALPARPAAASAYPAPGRPKVNSTLLPPAGEETDQFVHRFVSLLTAPRGTGPRTEAEVAPHIASIAQLMLAGLPTYRVRRSPSQVPPPPQHVYLQAVPAQSPEVGPSTEVEPSAAHSEIREIRPVTYVPLDASLPGGDSPLQVVEAKFAVMDEHWMPIVLQLEYVPMAAFDASPIVVAQVEPILTAEAPTVQGDPAPIANPTELSAYDSFVAALSDVLLQQGATRAAAMVGTLLEQSRVDGNTLGETLVQQLSAAGIGSLRGDQFALSPAFAEAASAWRAVLRGKSSEFAGADTLDQLGNRVIGGAAA